MILMLNNLIQKYFNNLNIRRFRQHLIHLMSPRFLYILILGVSSARHNHRLQNIMLPQVIPDLHRGFKAIHDRHRAVHEDQAIRVGS